MKNIYLKFQGGVSLIHFMLILVPLLAIGGFAVDMGNVIVSESELQNAADAGALEGARVLYCDNGDINHAGCKVNGVTVLNANTNAENATKANGTQIKVTVERGHWEFRSTETDTSGIERGGIFTPNPTTTANSLTYTDPKLLNYGKFKDFANLNEDTDEINAVRVTTAQTRGGVSPNPIPSFFGRLVGIDDYEGGAASVAYVGFAGKILPGELDWPIAMCSNYIGVCNVGRFISDNEDTGGWTNLEQPGGTIAKCTGAANASDVKKLIKSCSGGINVKALILGWDMQTSNGEVQSAFKDGFDCWSTGNVEDLDGNGTLDKLNTDADPLPDHPWNWLLPVINCDKKTGGGCNTLIGAVDVEVLWIVDKANKIDDDAPKTMTRKGPNGSLITWSASASADVTDKNEKKNGQQRWDSFAKKFNLKEPDGKTLAQWRQKSIYFAPSCESVDPLGGTGGGNFGVRSTVPVLVY
jgi:hypothetical protein